jgi:hypothetical protein
MAATVARGSALVFVDDARDLCAGDLRVDGCRAGRTRAADDIAAIFRSRGRRRNSARETARSVFAREEERRRDDERANFVRDDGGVTTGGALGVVSRRRVIRREVFFSKRQKDEEKVRVGAALGQL